MIGGTAFGIGRKVVNRSCFSISTQNLAPFSTASSGGGRGRGRGSHIPDIPLLFNKFAEKFPVQPDFTSSASDLLAPLPGTGHGRGKPLSALPRPPSSDRGRLDQMRSSGEACEGNESSLPKGPFFFKLEDAAEKVPESIIKAFGAGRGKGGEKGREGMRGREVGRGIGGEGMRGRGVGRGRGRGVGRGGRGRRDGEDWRRGNQEYGGELYLGDNADGEKLAEKLGLEVMNLLTEAFEDISCSVLPSCLDDAYVDALHTNCMIEFEPEYLMGEFNQNPDIDEKPPISLRDALEKMKPFLMAYEGIQSQEEWEEVIHQTMERVPLLKEIVDHYSGPDRVTAKKQQEELERVAKTLPEKVPDSVKQFIDHAVLSLQGNPGWGFHRKCQFMDKLTEKVSRHYK